jgi:uncharacterized membrane protein YccF (DUF307 family)
MIGLAFLLGGMALALTLLISLVRIINVMPALNLSSKGIACDDFWPWRNLFGI